MELCTAKDASEVLMFLKSDKCIGKKPELNQIIKDEVHLRNLIFENEIICLVDRKEQIQDCIIIMNDKYNNYDLSYEILFTTLNKDFIRESILILNSLLDKHTKKLKLCIVSKTNNINEINRIFKLLFSFPINTNETYYEFEFDKEVLR